MLEKLSIENIALIDKLEINLDNGLNILSGETGAGKSIIIDSLNFVLGERADKTLISNGEDYANVSAIFNNYLNSKVEKYLNDIGIEIEDILIISRKMTIDGRNECRINGKTTTLSMLKGLTELLVDIHGQHQHQSLLKPINHGILLDEIGSKTIKPLLIKQDNLYNNYHEILSKLNKFGDEADRARKIEILEFQLKEINDANIYENEENELLEKRKRIRYQEKIISALKYAQETLDGFDNASVSINLKATESELDSISEYDSRINSLVDRLDSSKVEICDIASTCSDILDELSYDSNTAESIEERLDKVRHVQRKYGGSFEALMDFKEKSQQEYDMLTQSEDTIIDLEKQLKNIEKDLIENSKELTNERITIKKQLEKDIISELNDLMMKGSKFEVDIQSDYNPSNIQNNGADTIEFLISPNEGQPLKPLAKIISGGEMSRFMLAIKSILADIDSIGTMVFDEIDTGISGKVSAVVAEKMCKISKNRQVIAVTHMPSLAAMADTHYLITKYTENGQTHTKLELLKDDIDEIARLIGGSDYSSYAVPHAKEMKAWAQTIKSKLK